jgi:hypothetical protein
VGVGHELQDLLSNASVETKKAVQPLADALQQAEEGGK